MSRAKLDALLGSLKTRSTHAFLVIRNDRIVYEWYAANHSRETPHSTASMAKAIVAGVSLGVAMSDRRLLLDERASKYVPAWATDEKKSAITLRHLGSHTSGLEDAEESGLAHDKLTGWKGEFWRRPPPPSDPFTLSRDATPVLWEPGSRFQYSNPGIAMLTFAVTAALKDAPEKDVRTLLRERVMRPIGVADAEWTCGYGKTVTVDGLPLVPSWGGGNYSPNAVARLARLMIRKGDWEGRRLIDPGAVEAITLEAGAPGIVAQGWWTNSDKRLGEVAPDAFWGGGAGHQIVLAVPSLGLIAVRFGENLDPSVDYHVAARRHLLEPLLAAVTLAPPAAPSPVIRSLLWAPSSSIVQEGKDSDTWPLTWADDDRMYTAYGDGTGFDKSGRKLSMGIARVEGTATAFTGTNLPSPTIDDLGDGPRGRKASGILMVGGTLYLWVRNVDGRGAQSELAWSTDHGATWTRSPWRFEEFGYPSFINFGMNYEGARDGFVYVVTHDGPSAYEPADRFILMRVPKERVRDRGAYEFLTGLEGQRKALWSPKVSERGALFTHPGRCRRSAMTYDAGLERYLWWQMNHEPGVDHRFRGGFGIYDAPEPWGPWTTVYFTPEWDIGPGETASFPTKWMSQDGRAAWLVFSYEDSFAVRKATFVVPRLAR
jgi:CubicO group peptidase (beta-lactamase class C family)